MYYLAELQFQFLDGASRRRVGEHTGVLVVVVGGTHEVDGQTDALCVTLSRNYVGISI